MDWREFQELARKAMSQYFSVRLSEKRPKGFPKRFDMVSPKEDIVGDAKFLTLVRRTRLPPAKFMEIAGHVWLLERTEARKRFLVFGNQRRVPEWWLEKYGFLLQNVDFYFVDETGSVSRLNQPKAHHPKQGESK